MEKNRQALIVVKAPAEMAELFPLWHEQIGLAVCLIKDGDCHFCAFHEDETASLPRQIMKQLGLASDDLSFHPEIKGFSTYDLPFTDEQALAALIWGTSGLLEEAEDYLVNYEFALDEKLDPSTFLRRTDTSGREGPSAQPAAAQPKPEAQYLKAQFTIEPHSESQEWIIFENLQEGGGCLVIGDQRQIFLRDDRRALALHIGADLLDLETFPKRIQIHSKLASSHLSEYLRSKDQTVECTLVGDFLYLSVLSPAPTSITSDPKILASLAAYSPDATPSFDKNAKSVSPVSGFPYKSGWVYASAFALFGVLFSSGIGLGVSSLQVGSDEAGTQFFGNLALLMTELGIFS